MACQKWKRMVEKARQMVFIGYVCIADLVVISDYRIRIMYRWLLFIEKDN